ncbi:hypothetical protein [Actinacidiphila glaucinigra]|uniref:hypothetical protein n=1 Tax=Actinacidiphila glaucinigra TaxID=235986 RepID=UPI003670D43E
MTHLLVLALATFFVWECLVRPPVTAGCSLLPVPDGVTAYVKSLTAAGVAWSLDHWVDAHFLVPLAAASAAGALHLLSRSSESPQIATVARGRARRSMPMPGP